MNRKMILYIIGRILKAEALLLLIPAAVSLAYGEICALSFVATAAISAALGFLLSARKPKDRTIYAREGFVVVALAWVSMSLIGALPFYISGEVSSFIDCFFETVSGFTTTGSTVIAAVESLSRGLLFWRGFTNWIGGMGVLVFVMAVVPLAGKRSMYLMRAEVPGPVVGKIVPKVKSTAKILYSIYLGLTALEIIMLLFGGLSLFDSVVHSFGTAGTGGFSTYSDSIAHFGSAYVEIVITVFMALFGINFNVFYFLLIRNFASAFKSEELRVYICIILISIAVITLNILPLYEAVGTAIRHSAFQVSTIITTTGFSTTDFNIWPQTSRMLLLILMFCGGCAGSTSGGLKVSRLLLLFRTAKKELKRLQHPRYVSAVKLEGKLVGEETLNDVNVYFFVYIIIAITTVFLLSFDIYDFETNFSAMATALNNVGPGLGAVGPINTFAGYSGFSKLLLSLNMLLGRLEIFPILLAISPSIWKRQ